MRRGCRFLCGAGLGLLLAGAIGAATASVASVPIATASIATASIAAASTAAEYEASLPADGVNPHPVHLVRPPAAPLSAMALLGRRIFFDPALSSSGRMSCASCHSPDHHYASPTDAPAMFGGPHLNRQGVRAVPSLMYLERQSAFSIGPDNEENENVTLAQLAAAGAGAPRTRKTALDTAQTAANLVPQGGLFWDGRADTLQDQAMGPMQNPLEMDGGSVQKIASALRHAPYARQMRQLFGKAIFASPRFTVAEALFAVARYQIEDIRFHLFTSKFDYWLEGKARLTPTELRGYELFNDPQKADCGGCHLDKPTPDGLPPLFTDQQFEALGVPRNPALAANRNPTYYDMGICGPYRTDMARQTQYCGMFLTPTLRNVATRHAFFHNGVFHSLRQVLDFYDFRDVDPGRVYPRATNGKVEKFNDLPRKYRANIDVTDPPFNRKPSEKPAMTPQDEADIIAFLKTLTDGYK
jgi:cytochrome c peroxidase